MTCDEVKDRGWSGVDVVVVTGDAYVDHPSFGAALIGRVLESRGYRVAVISMPDWRDAESVKVFGRPRLFFAITSGNVDSCLMRQTAFRKKRSDDPYAPGGEGGGKPKLATVVYANLARAAFPGVAFYAVPSRNHMKPKKDSKGVIRAARPKYHIYFPIDTVTDAAEYRQMKERLLAIFPYFDDGAKDAARFLFGVDGAQVTFVGGDHT